VASRCEYSALDLTPTVKSTMAGLGIEKMDGDDGMKIHHTELTPSTIRHGHNRSDSSAGTPTPTSPPYGEHGGLMHRVS